MEGNRSLGGRVRSHAALSPLRRVCRLISRAPRLHNAFPAFIWLQLAGVLGCGLCLGGCSKPADHAAPQAQASESDVRMARREPEGPPRVKIATNLGDFVVELDSEHVPLTVENFLQYVDEGHYDGTIFHQVVEGYIALAGAYTPELAEKPSRTPIRNEAHNGGKNVRGTIAMARDLSSIDSSTCQFFVNLHDNAGLDHRSRTAEGYGYCTFGSVIEGLDVLDRIAKVETRTTDQFELIPVEPVVIRSIRRVEELPVRNAAAPRQTTVR
ncbi:MAG: peptidylprolyl isomerase [Pirellulales bacterium]|nr:peptidylprolyl isomerase [Pirellulales bacterium]